MKPAEVMTAAADKLAAILDDDIAEGPWEYVQSSDPDRLGWWVYPADGSDIFHGGDDDRWTEARWIAAMDPLVGRAVVALLRHSAARVRINPDALIDMELILAQAILGDVAS